MISRAVPLAVYVLGLIPLAVYQTSLRTAIANDLVSFFLVILYLVALRGVGVLALKALVLVRGDRTDETSG